MFHSFWKKEVFSRMKSEICSLVFFFMAISLMNITNSSASLQQRSLYRRRIRLCGSQLADALSFVCNGTYYNPTVQQDKRFVFTYGDLLNPYWSRRANSNGYPLHKIPSMFPKRNEIIGQQSGVVVECCHNSCTYNQMRAYCGVSESSEEEEERDIWMK